MNRTQLRRRLKAALDERGISQSELALELGVSRSFVCMLLSGDRNPSMRMALRLEAITGISLRDFARVA